MSWFECLVDSDYEIWSEFPYPIRRKGTDKIIKESIDSNGYVRIYLNNIKSYKHRIIAQQFIPNDDESNRLFIDHIDHNKINNHISNLRWVSQQENLKNKSSHRGIIYEYVDEIDDEAIEITDYGDHRFQFYYYSEADDSFYFFNGKKYRKLHVNVVKNNTSQFVQAYDTDNKLVKIILNKFKRLYGIEF